MKKRIILLVFMMVFIVLGTINVNAGIKHCNISHHDVKRRSDGYTYVNGNIWYYCDGSGSPIYYELNYANTSSYYERPTVVNWGDSGVRTHFTHGYVAGTMLDSWKHKIYHNKPVKKDNCLWSNTKAERQSNITNWSALCGGYFEDSIISKSIKEA